MEQLKVGTNDLSYVAKKKVIVAVALVSSMEAFPTMGLALELEVPTTMMANIPGQKGGVLELWPGWPTGGGGDQYPPEGTSDQYPPEVGGGQYPAGSDGGSHNGGCPAAGDPAHSIMGDKPI
jgi:hypothetical protein